jgi:bifunctional non-homologous end joining protein LigD
VLRLPAPMLLRSAPLPQRSGYVFEPKWDGFRALVSTTNGLYVRSRRGWNMTELVPELCGLPPGRVYDGELVAFGDDGLPRFPRLCRRMLQKDRTIPVMFIAFDLIGEHDQSYLNRSYHHRRHRLEALDLAGPAWTTTPVTSDGAMLWEWVCDRGMEGVVSKRVASPYLPGQRRWLKTKNREYWRYPLEVAAAHRSASAT